MSNQRSRIYGGFVVLWMLCAVVLGVHAGTGGSTAPDHSASFDSRTDVFLDGSVYFAPEHSDNSDPFSVLIYREPKGKRKLEPRADSSEWQVIFRSAVVAC